MKKIRLFIFYVFLTRLPGPTFPLIGPMLEFLRYRCLRPVFKKCGEKVNICPGAKFGSGANIEVGNYSSIGINAKIPNNIFIGNYVMMGPNVTIYSSKHDFDRIDIPMLKQGVSLAKRTIIEDDVWIGSHSIILPGRIIKEGTIIGAGAVVTKDFPAYSIIGGNPAKLIGSRILI